MCPAGGKLQLSSRQLDEAETIDYPRVQVVANEAQLRPPDLSHWALFVRFLRFGFTAFEGPVAQIAMIRRELVDEEKWIGSGRFNRLLAVMP